MSFGQKKENNGKLKLGLVGVGAVALLAIVLFGGWILYQSRIGGNIDSNKYQAVFFTNGQVYFGRLKEASGGYYKLTDIFLSSSSGD